MVTHQCLDSSRHTLSGLVSVLRFLCHFERLDAPAVILTKFIKTNHFTGSNIEVRLRTLKDHGYVRSGATFMLTNNIFGSMRQTIRVVKFGLN